MNKKNILSALIITIGGFALFNLAFILAYLVSLAVGYMKGNSDGAGFFNPLILPIYLAVILIISVLLLITKFGPTFKATILAMPLMVAQVVLGIALNEQPKLLVVGIGSLLTIAVLAFLKFRKLPWQYYFSTLYVAILGLCIVIFNIEI